MTFGLKLHATVAGLAALCLSFAEPAFAFPVNDGHGHVCDNTALVSDGMGGSICPGFNLVNGPGKILRGYFGYPFSGDLDFSIFDAGTLHDDDDPWARFSSSRTGQVAISGSGGASGTQAAGSRTTDISGGGDGHLNLSRLAHFGDGNHTVSLGAYINYSNIKTEFDFISPSTVRRDRFNAGGTVEAHWYSAYLFAKVGGLFGSGEVNDSLDGSKGRFNTSGHEAAVEIGNVFDLINRGVPGRTGYDLKFQAGLNAVHYQEIADQFVDTSGFFNGRQEASSWTLGARGRLSSNVYDGPVTWTPYIGAFVSQLVDYRNTIDVVAQTGVTPGVEYLAAPGHTFGGASAGFNVRDKYGVNYGLDFNYMNSSNVESFGGRMSVRMPIVRWLGLAG